jgi:nucleoside-diphosphate-sugar epimerase
VSQPKSVVTITLLAVEDFSAQVIVISSVRVHLTVILPTPGRRISSGGRVKILVTGGAGYIGSRLLHTLASVESLRVRRIRVLDNMREEKFPSLMNLPRGVDYEFVLGDIRNEDDVEAAIGDDTDVVVHLAALCNATISFERRDATEEINYGGTVNVVRAARRAASVRRFIYASTTSVYGPTSGIVDEESPCLPASPYAEFKLKGEQDVLGLSTDTGGRLQPTVLRFATVYGYAPGLRVHTVVNIFAFRAAVGAPMEVFGSGNQLRPFVHVSDVSRAIAFCIDDPRAGGGVFNVVGENASVNQIVGLLERHFPRLRIVQADKEILNQISYEVDGSKLLNLGFTMQHTLQDGVEEYARLYGSFARLPLPSGSPPLRSAAVT